MEPYRISSEDRELFKRCRRAWDFGARARQGRRLRQESGPPRLDLALRKALDVYYFPGMWSWGRSIVVPLVHRAIDDAMGGPGRPAALDLEVAHGHRLIDAYASWAPPLDRFTPVEVASEISVNVPDPVLWDRDLATMEGGAVSYSTWLDAIVVDDDNRPWLVCHRVISGDFSDPEVLALDEAALADCWAWGHYSLGPPMAGALITEIRASGATLSGATLSGATSAPAPDDQEAEMSFRRQVVEYSSEELASAGRQLAAEVLDMIDAGLVLYPNPTPHNCGRCPFRAPCRAVRAGDDPQDLLALGYESRPEPVLVEGRLGGRTWSMNRGARPNRFGEG